MPGTYLDSATHLRWQNPTDIKLSNADAILYCEDLTLGEFSDFRLPSVDELRTLVTGCAVAAEDCKAAKDCIMTTQCYSNACEGCGEKGDKSCYLPAEITDTTCSNGISYENWFWSSTVIFKTADCPDGSSTGGFACFGIAWYVDYRAAQVKTTTDTSLIRVRCVRNE